MGVISLCGFAGGNTGPIECDVRRGIPGAIIVGGAEFTPEQYSSSETFMEAWLEAINQPTGSPSKLYPFPEIQNVTNNTEEATTATTGLGFTFRIREGRPSYTFGVIVGTNLEKQLRKFSNQILPVFVFDKNGNVWGKRNAAGNFVGTRAQIFVEPKPFSDGNSVESEYTNVSVSFLSMSDFADFAAFVPTSFNTADLEGLIDGKLTLVENNAGVLKVAINVDHAGLSQNLSLFSVFADELADADLWVAASGAGFTTPITVTSVTTDANTNTWVVTLDSTTYTGLTSGTPIRVSLVDPGALYAKDVRGLESIPLIFEKA